MVMLDAVIEPIAPLLDFWEFNGGKAPLKNYLGWILVALPLNYLYHVLNIKVNGSFWSTNLPINKIFKVFLLTPKIFFFVFIDFKISDLFKGL